MFDDLCLDGKYVPDLTREEVGEAARLISAEIYRRRPDLIPEDGSGGEWAAIERAAVEAAKGDLRMEDKPLKDLTYDDIDEAALLLQHRIHELDEEFERVYGCKIDDSWLEARMYEDSTRADVAVMDAEKVAGIAAGRIKRKPFFNPFAPDSTCNPFAHLAEQGKGSEA